MTQTFDPLEGQFPAVVAAILTKLGHTAIDLTLQDFENIPHDRFLTCRIEDGVIVLKMLTREERDATEKAVLAAGGQVLNR